MYIRRSFGLTNAVKKTLIEWFNRLIMPQIKKKSFVQKNGLIAVWSMAGFMAMGYIGFLATGSDTRQPQNAQLATAGTITTSPVERQLAALSANMKKIANTTNANIEKLANKTETTSRELSLIKEALGPNTASLPDTKPVEKERVAQKQLAADRQATGLPPKISVNVLPLTENDKVAVLAGTDPSETYGITLARANSISSLERHWRGLGKDEKKLLTGLKPHYINRGTTAEPLYFLILGPFDLKRDAQNRCGEFAKLRVECGETQYRATPYEKIQTAGK